MKEKEIKGTQKIRCDVAECTHNCIKDCTCMLNEISVCNCSYDKTKDPLKDTACSSYEFANVQESERF